MQLPLSRAEQELLREVLAYMSRRLFDDRDGPRLGELEDRLDDLLLHRAPGAGNVLVLEKVHVPVLRTALNAYIATLSQPGTDRSNRPRVATLGRLLQRVEARRRGLGRLLAWLRERW